MTLGCLSLSANSLAQRQRISLDLKDCTVMSLFQAIQQQTNLYFVYNQKNFAGIDKLNVQAKEEEVETLLNRLFQGQKIAIIFDDNTVIAKPLQPETGEYSGKSSRPDEGSLARSRNHDSGNDLRSHFGC